MRHTCDKGNYLYVCWRREVVLFFSVMDEGNSLFTNDNQQKFLRHGAPPVGTPEHQEFEESNLMHAINGACELISESLRSCLLEACSARITC